jgi:hypothetical protein
MRGGGRKDVPGVEGSADGGEAVRRALEQMRGNDSTEPFRCGQQQAVVRSDEVVAPAGSQRDGAPFGAHAGVHDREVNTCGKVGQGGPQDRGAVGDAVAGNAVADVDEPDVGGDAQDDALACRHGWIGHAEVGQERNDSCSHATHGSRGDASARAFVP